MRQREQQILLPVKVLLGMRAPYNPRSMEPDAMARLRASLREFGVAEPVCVNTRTGNIVGGHQRVVAADAEGWESFPVWFVDASPARKRALNVAIPMPTHQSPILSNWPDYSAGYYGLE